MRPGSGLGAGLLINTNLKKKKIPASWSLHSGMDAENKQSVKHKAS